MLCNFSFIATLCFLILLVSASEQGEIKYEKYSRTRRGLLLDNMNVNLDAGKITNLLSLNKLSGVETVTQTSTFAPSTTEGASFKPFVTNRVSNGPSCGRKIVHHTELITNGLSTKPGDWPWHAAVYRLRTTRSTQQYICGGTLLSVTRVLTAGHCVVENNDVIVPERLFIFLGKYNLAGGDIGSQEKNVFDIVLHPEFSRDTLENDIAILKLSSRVTYSNYVQPICLWGSNNAGKNFLVSKLGTVVGWGYTEEDTLASQLARAIMPVVSDLVCIRSNPVFYSRFVSDKTFCAGHRNGTGACNGDSGGGLFFSETDSFGQETWTIRGIVSLTVSRKDRNICDPNEFTLFTDVIQYRDFIDSNL